MDRVVLELHYSHEPDVRSSSITLTGVRDYVGLYNFTDDDLTENRHAVALQIGRTILDTIAMARRNSSDGE